jgi:hypothetical protein
MRGGSDEGGTADYGEGNGREPTRLAALTTPDTAPLRLSITFETNQTIVVKIAGKIATINGSKAIQS